MLLISGKVPKQVETGLGSANSVVIATLIE